MLEVFEGAFVLQLRVQGLDSGQCSGDLVVCLRDQTAVIGLILFYYAKHEFLLLKPHLFLLDLVHNRLNLDIELIGRYLIKIIYQVGILCGKGLVRILNHQKAHHFLDLLLVHLSI